MTTLSITIITKNEHENIRSCLQSIAWANEIIVVDSGSDDGTLEICREFTDQVFVDTDWQGFGVQKNRALEKANCDWVLSLDADEIVSDELAKEILKAIQGAAQIYELPRLSRFCGKEIRHSGWWPDYVARLFPRGQAHFSDDQVHERLIFTTQASQLKQPLRHNTAPNLDDVLEKMNRYSRLGAEKNHRNGKTSGLSTAIAHGLWAFLWSYFGRAGFLDGREGFILAVCKAENSYYRYLKLMYLNQKND